MYYTKDHSTVKRNNFYLHFTKLSSGMKYNELESNKKVRKNYSF